MGIRKRGPCPSPSAHRTGPRQCLPSLSVPTCPPGETQCPHCPSKSLPQYMEGQGSQSIWPARHPMYQVHSWGQQTHRSERATIKQKVQTGLDDVGPQNGHSGQSSCVHRKKWQGGSWGLDGLLPHPSVLKLLPCHQPTGPMLAVPVLQAHLPAPREPIAALGSSWVPLSPHSLFLPAFDPFLLQPKPSATVRPSTSGLWLWAGPAPQHLRPAPQAITCPRAGPSIDFPSAA